MNPLHESLTDPASFEGTKVSYDDSDSWPPAPTEITHILAGALADRVRRRLGAPDESTVTLTELTTYGGTDWTQENDTLFTIACGTTAVEFHPKSSTADWRQDAPLGYDSVYARFDAWLQVAERPAELFAEWFEFEAEAGRFVQYRSKPDTILTRVAAERFYRPDHVTLIGAGDGFGRLWELDIVAPADANGFSKVYDHMTLCYAEGVTLSDDVARAVLTEITDQLMPGRERY
jgi:hypothetical protein